MSTPRARVEIQPMAGSLGADIDLAGPVDDDSFAVIRQALDNHLVIFLHGLELAPEELVALTRRFGPISRAPYIKHMDEHPDIVAVKKAADERKVSTFGNAWHSDFSFLDQPPMASLLYACEVPTHGGDTLFANMYAAYDALSDGMKRLLDGLDAMHSGKPYGTGGIPGNVAVSKSIGIERNRPEADREIPHPVVRVHPATGRKALFINSIYTQRFDGMTVEESKPLLDFLYAHAIRPEFTCRLRWTAHDLAIWDNRCTLHYAVNDYDGQDRLLYRTMVQGERPVPATPRVSSAA
ncbi:MAG TPA: TauD/TfdA family dioxygenase [Inquilinus sp.]|nr:TauD/TfdA family dioxygenase [Inquilinus sp.]